MCLSGYFKLPWCLLSESDLQNIKCCVQQMYMMKAGCVHFRLTTIYNFTKESETCVLYVKVTGVF